MSCEICCAGAARIWTKGDYYTYQNQGTKLESA